MVSWLICYFWAGRLLGRGRGWCCHRSLLWPTPLYCASAVIDILAKVISLLFTSAVAWIMGLHSGESKTSNRSLCSSRTGLQTQTGLWTLGIGVTSGWRTDHEHPQWRHRPQTSTQTSTGVGSWTQIWPLVASQVQTSLWSQITCATDISAPNRAWLDVTWVVMGVRLRGLT